MNLIDFIINEDKTKGDTFEARMKQVFLGVAETI